MSSIDTRQKLIYGDGALQKASLTYKNAQTGRTWGRIPSGKHTGGRQ